MGKKQSALWISISCATLALAGTLGCGGSAMSANPTPTPTPTPPPAPQLAFNTASLSAPLNTQVPVSSFTITNCTATGQISWNIVARTPGNGPAQGAVWPSHKAGTDALGVIDMGNSIPGGPVTSSDAGDPVFTVTANCGGITATLTLTSTIPGPPGLTVPAPSNSVSLSCSGVGVVSQSPCVLQGSSFNVVFDLKKTSNDSGTFLANDALAAGQWAGTSFLLSDADCKTQPSSFASSNWISATEIKFGAAANNNPAGQASLWLKNPPDMNGNGGGLSCTPNVLSIQ